MTGIGDYFHSALKSLDDYFAPKKNVDYEFFQFRQVIQEEGETTDQFVNRLRKLAAVCEFHDEDSDVKSVIIQNCHTKCLRRHTLHNLLTKARALNANERQAIGMENNLSMATTQIVQARK